MPPLDIAHQRLHNQRLTGAKFEKPADVVAWLGAVQSQEYLLAKWALGLRSQNMTDADVEHAFNEGHILRTHVMRPTWHFVTPADIRWLLALTAPRVDAVNAYMYRQVELDDTMFRRSNEVIVKALEGGKHLTREELATALEGAGIVAEGFRLSYLMQRAELDALICSGPRRSKQFTYALLDERAPRITALNLNREEALAELVRRYFTSHGPATVQDFVGWSGITVADAKAGLQAVGSHLVREVIGDKTYWFCPSASIAEDSSPTAFLLPPYDEYTIGYKDHGDVLDAAHLEQARNPVFNGSIAINGQIVGTWRRTVKGKSVIIEHAPFRPFSEDENEAFTLAVQRYGEFVGMRVVVA